MPIRAPPAEGRIIAPLHPSLTAPDEPLSEIQRLHDARALLGKYEMAGEIESMERMRKPAACKARRNAIGKILTVSLISWSGIVTSLAMARPLTIEDVTMLSRIAAPTASEDGRWLVW